MITEQEFGQLRERVKNLEEEVARLRDLTAGLDWEARIADLIRKGDMNAAVNFYQERVGRHASMSEAMGHVMEIKKKIGK